jgi:transcriptional regulator with XRE-family HTH domain
MTDAATPIRSPRPWTATLDGARLRQLRRQHHLTQHQLAAKAGISTATVARLEQAPRITCRSRTLGRLARALDEDPARLAPATPS